MTAIVPSGSEAGPATDPELVAPGTGGRPTVAEVARRLPVTVVTVVLLLVGGLASGAFWSSLAARPWADAVAYGLPAVRAGHWWTPLTGSVVVRHPGAALAALVLTAAIVAMSELRLGSRRTAAVLVVAQPASVLASLGLVALAASAAPRWPWAVETAGALGAGLTPGLVALVAVASATVPAPWRLRLRIVLVAAVAVGLLFEGHLSDLGHALAVAVCLPLGRRLAGLPAAAGAGRAAAVHERLGRREWRLVAAAGLVALAAVKLLTWLLPVEGPLGSTADPTGTGVEALLGIAIALLLAEGLRRGRRPAWVLAIVVGALYALLGLVVAGGVVYALVTGQLDQVQLAGPAIFVPTALIWTAELVWLIVGRRAFAVPSRRRSRRRNGAGTVGPQRAREELHRHGGSTLSWMTTWPDNRYLEHPDGLTAYRVHAGVAVALSDPVVDPGDRAVALAEFRAHAERAGWVPCLFSTTEALATAAQADGWRALQVAEDTLIDLEGLEFTGKPWQNIRSAFNRAGKAGIEHRLVRLADEPRAVLAQVRAISEEWVGDKGLPEMGFTLGGVEEALDPEVRTGLAVDAEGTIHGVTSWLPVYGPGADGTTTVVGWTLDVMRRRQEGFRAVVEFLIASACQEFRSEGARFVSLSGAPLARTGDDDSGEAAVLDRVLDRMGALLEPYYGFRSLHAFKAKFQPRYAPMFLVYRDEADLPRVGIGIGRAYLPDAGVRDLLELARH